MGYGGRIGCGPDREGRYTPDGDGFCGGRSAGLPGQRGRKWPGCGRTDALIALHTRRGVGRRRSGQLPDTVLPDLHRAEQEQEEDELG